MSETNLRDWVGRSETVADVATATPYAALIRNLGLAAGTANGWNGIAAIMALAVFSADRAAITDRSRTGIQNAEAFCRPSRFLGGCGLAVILSFARRYILVTRSHERQPLSTLPEKPGRTGRLVFVKVRHEVRREGETAVALNEHHNIVYRDLPSPSDVAPPPLAAPSSAAWSRNVVADDVLLFRYSALTFNGHRIHYDRQYVTQTEGYPGLIVHGPLDCDASSRLVAAAVAVGDRDAVRI